MASSSTTPTTLAASAYATLQSLNPAAAVRAAMASSTEELTVWMGEQVARKGALSLLYAPLRYVEAWYWTCALRDGFVVLCGLPPPRRVVLAAAAAVPPSPAAHGREAEEDDEEHPQRAFMSTWRLVCDIAIMLPRPGLGVQLPAFFTVVALGVGTVLTWQMSGGKGGGAGLARAFIWPAAAGCAIALQECSTDIAGCHGDTWAPLGFERERPAAAAAAGAAIAGAAPTTPSAAAVQALPLSPLALPPQGAADGAGATGAGESSAAAALLPPPPPPLTLAPPRPVRGIALHVGRRREAKRGWCVFSFSLSSAVLWMVSTGESRTALDTTFSNAVASLALEVSKRVPLPSWFSPAVAVSTAWSEGPMKAQAAGLLTFAVFLALSKVDVPGQKPSQERVRLAHALVNKLDV